MKTNRIIAMLAAAVLASACAQEETEAPDGLASNQFRAYAEGNFTKVSLNETDKTLTWDEGDQVSVFAPDFSNNLFTSDAKTGSSSTILHGGPSFVVDADATYYALYPYSAEHSMDKAGVITTVIPTVQTPKTGNIPVNFAVAISQGQSLAFKNVCGLIGFAITREDIVSVTVKTNGEGEYLTGKVNITCAGTDGPSWSIVEGEGVSEVTLVTKDKFAPGNYYVAVLPQILTNLTVTMYNAKGEAVSRTSSGTNVLNRSHMLWTNEIDGGASFDGKKITEIKNAADLQGFLASADSYVAEDVVTLVADIDLSGYDLVPATSFAGTLSGAYTEGEETKNYAIKNWNTKTALFNTVSGTVQNITVDASCNLEVQPKGDAAFIALENTGTITGCVNYGTVTSVSEAFTQEVAQTHNDRMVGAIVAKSSGQVTSCVNNGVVKLTPVSVGKYTRQYVGGVVGQFCSSSEVEGVVGCENLAEVAFEISEQHSGKLFVGGVCGGTPAGADTFGDYGTMKNCANKADVKISAGAGSSSNNYINIGGVVGYAEADLDNCDNSSSVSVVYPVEISGNTFAKRPAVGGVAGTVLYSIKDCDNSGNILVEGGFGSAGNEKPGLGYRDGAYFGGVVAFAGSTADHTMTSCTNSGRLNLKLNMKEDDDLVSYIGGIAGNAIAQVTACENTGALNINNRLYKNYAGGVIGMLAASASVRGLIKSCSNNASITYDAVLTDETTAVAAEEETASENNRSSEVCVGGVVGHMAYHRTEEANRFAQSHNMANGDISFVNGPVGGTCYVGGLAGYNGKNRLPGTDASKLISSGDIVVNSRMTSYVGGIVGRTSDQVLNVTVNMSEITVTNPGENSMIGGICGDRATNGNGDAKMYIESSVDISVTCETKNGTCLGIWNGRRSETKEAFHTTYFKGNVSYNENVTFGVIAGYLTAAAQITVGSSGNVNIRSAKVNGEDLPSISTDDATALNAALFGVIEEGATIAVNTGKLIQ